ncbi:MAG: hypothetical protein EA409_09035 [Saprospirales bacterium]|nr:MAG: hypothetical protein EA409_09035 [Saprospirales bacterium]
MTKEQIVKLVGELYKKQSSVREYLDLFANHDQNVLLEKYKKKIDNSFYTRMGNPKLDLKVTKKAVSDFSKLGVTGGCLAELNFHLVELGINFTQTFGDINEKFYQTIENAFYQGLLKIQNEGILDKYKYRANQLKTNAQGIGWGFSDAMTSIYWEFYDYEEETDYV